MHYIELVKFDKGKPQELRTPFERWLQVIKFGELYARDLAPLPEDLRAEEGVQMAIDKMREARASDEVREMIWAREKAALDEGNRLAMAERRGREEGTLLVARRMLAKGMSLQEVVELTGVDPEHLESP